VWTDQQASFLIDTVLSELPFPEIYLRSSTTPDGQTLHEVVDGQQRITSLLRFGRNELVLVGAEVAAKWNGKSIDDLNDTEKTGFWNYTIVVRDIGSASETEIRALFGRLNRNQVGLTEQELRHAAYPGRFLSLMEELADDSWWLDKGIVSVRQVRRMEDAEFVSELFVGLMAGPQNKKDTLDNYYIDYQNEFEDEERQKNRFKKTLGLLRTILVDDKDVRAWNGKSDFYSLFLAVEPLTERKSFGQRKRESVRNALMEFRAKVDQAKRRDNTKRFEPEVHAYAQALTRAASDLSSRIRRLEVLQAVIDSSL
jgi:hypothetical protein